MNKLIHYLLGKGKRDERIIREKTEEAHKIKSSITKDLIILRRDVDKVNKDMQKHLDKISKKIGVVTEQIAVATGNK